jgi:hypothetical protein
MHCRTERPAPLNSAPPSAAGKGPRSEAGPPQAGRIPSNPMKHTRWAWALGAALWLGASVTAAQSQQGEREAERTALYEEGVKLAEAGRWPDAADRFQRVVAIRPAPRVRFTLGEAQEKCGRLASAKATYALALEEARAAGDQQAASAAAGALVGIEKRVPRLLLHLAEPVQGARASLDGRDVELGERALELDVGAHHVQVRAPSREPFERQVQAAEGKTTELKVQLEPVHIAGMPGAGASDTGGPGPVSGVSSDTGPGAPSSGPPVGTWVLAATGVAATVVGGVLYATGHTAYDEAAARCPAGTCTQAGAADDGNGARGRMIGGDVLMVVGMAAVAGAGLWWAVTAAQTPAPEVPAHARLVFGVSRDALVLGLWGTL